MNVSEPYWILPSHRKLTLQKFSVILAAAGSSRRFNDPQNKKPFVSLAGKPIWVHSAELFRQRADVEQLLVVISPDDREFFASKFANEIRELEVAIVDGGAERADSVGNGLRQVANDVDFVAIHDAARPCISNKLVEAVFQQGKKSLAAIPAVPINSTIKRSVANQLIEQTVDRTGLYLAQTPQVFSRELLIRMFANRGVRQPTDEAQLAEWLGEPVSLVDGSATNIKITTQQDLAFATAALHVLGGAAQQTQ